MTCRNVNVSVFFRNVEKTKPENFQQNIFIDLLLTNKVILVKSHVSLQSFITSCWFLTLNRLNKKSTSSAFFFPPPLQQFFWHISCGCDRRKVFAAESFTVTAACTVMPNMLIKNALSNRHPETRTHHWFPYNSDSLLALHLTHMNKHTNKYKKKYT